MKSWKLHFDTKAFFKTGSQGQVRKAGPTCPVLSCFSGVYSQNTVYTICLEPAFPVGNPALHSGIDWHLNESLMNWVWWIKHGVLKNVCVMCFYFDGIDLHTHRDSHTQHRRTHTFNSTFRFLVSASCHCAVKLQHQPFTPYKDKSSNTPIPGLFVGIVLHCVLDTW